MSFASAEKTLAGSPAAQTCMPSICRGGAGGGMRPRGRCLRPNTHLKGLTETPWSRGMHGTLLPRTVLQTATQEHRFLLVN